MRLSQPLTAPRWMRRFLEQEAQRFFYEGGGPRIDFREPAGEPAFADPRSVSWQVFKNPLTLFIGGVTAVLLELAEPRVRTGIWEHTTFRTDPLRRLRRTGLAAMITVYGPASRAEAMIAGVGRMHGRVEGVTPGGEPYAADDPELLLWVGTTAAFGFIEAYRHFAHPLSEDDISRYYAEGQRAAGHYGVTDPVTSDAGREALFVRMAERLEPSPIIFEFLEIMRRAPILPRGTRVFQGMLIRAGVDCLPVWVREKLELDGKWRLRGWERRLIGLGAKMLNRTPLEGTPPVEACLRLGLPADFLFRQ